MDLNQLQDIIMQVRSKKHYSWFREFLERPLRNFLRYKEVFSGYWYWLMGHAKTNTIETSHNQHIKNITNLKLILVTSPLRVIITHINSSSFSKREGLELSTLLPEKFCHNKQFHYLQILHFRKLVSETLKLN